MAYDDELADMRGKLQLLKLDTRVLDDREVANAPIFTEAARRHVDRRQDPDAGQIFPQHGLLGGGVDELRKIGPDGGGGLGPGDAPFVHYNITAPSSTFICGSQGSGKSHTLSCLLENCLIPSEANTLSEPLTAIVFHYDPFSSDEGGQPCEAAHLSSNPDVKVRVLCAPTNVVTIKAAYKHLENVHVQELRLSQSNLNTKRMLDLMAVSSLQGGGMPLYFHVVTRILKDMRIKQQKTGGCFDYRAFKQALDAAGLDSHQKGPLAQRLETLESFLAPEHVEQARYTSLQGRYGVTSKTDTATKWEGKPGQLTIVDLSCPCVTAESACALFNICLNVFLEQNRKTGRVIALDEAHKYMTDSTESQTLTESLLSTIRLQRHLGARIIIATQEPTISPKLLDLCSVTIVHRFTSPDWLQSLKKHLAAAQSHVMPPPDQLELELAGSGREDPLAALFIRIVALRQGEALLFCPSALVGVDEANAQNGNGFEDRLAVRVKPQNGTAGLSNGSNKHHDHHEASNGKDEQNVVQGAGHSLVRLGCGVMHIRVRERVTEDGGRSVMAG